MRVQSRARAGSCVFALVPAASRRQRMFRLVEQTLPQGRVSGRVTQNCAATLEPFELQVEREFTTVIQACMEFVDDQLDPVVSEKDFRAPALWSFAWLQG